MLRPFSSPAQVSGRKLTDFLTPQCRDHFSSVLLPAVRVTGSSSSVILQFVSKAGSIHPGWVDIVATRRRGVVHRLEVTVTPYTASQTAEDTVVSDDIADDDDDRVHDECDDGVAVFDGPACGSTPGLSRRKQ